MTRRSSSPLTLVACLAVASIALPACEASNAILDVQLSLPPNPDPGRPMYVRVLISRGEFPLPENASVPEPHELGVGRTTYEFSVEDAEVDCDPSVAGSCDLLVEVRFCLDRECAGLCTGCPGVRTSDPQGVVRYQVEEPLFPGRRTLWNPSVAEVPTCADDPAICSSVTEPSDPGCSITTELTSSGAPTYLCPIAHCDDIVCADDPGGAGGQCQGDGAGGGGRTGPHLCDR